MTMRDANRDAGATTISQHDTSQGIVRYRRWPSGWVSVELLDGSPAVLAWIVEPDEPGKERERAGANST